MGVFDAVPHDLVTDLDDLDGADSADDSPLASVTLTKSALSKKERSDMVTRGHGADEAEKAPVAAHLTKQGPGKILVATTLHTFGSEPVMEALCCQITSDGRMVAAGCRDGRIRIASSHQDIGLMHTLGNEVPGSLAPCLTALRWRPESWTSSETKNVLLAARGDEIIHYHATSGRLMSAIKETDNQVYALATCPDAQLFATAGLDRNIRVYHEGRSDAPAVLKSGGAGGISGHSLEGGSEGSGHSNSVYAASWVPGSPDLLISGGWDQTVQVWDRRVGHAVRSIFGPYICGDSIDVHGSHMLTGSWRNKTPLQLWDLGSGQLLTNLPMHQPNDDSCLLYSAKFGASGSGHGNTVLAGGSGSEPAVHIMKSSGAVVGHCPTKSNVHAIDTAATDEGLSVAVCCAEELLLLHIPPRHS